jgi:anhydro-N-acetylmuramic acid kinase
MKNKIYTAIGMMSGTSMDGVDISIIKSDGIDQFVKILDEYHEYDDNLHKQMVNLRNLILNHKDLEKYSQQLIDLDREITLFHSKIVKNIVLKYKKKIDFVGFHGQTIFHESEKKISKQLGDGNLMSQLIEKNVVFDFRQEDLKNNGRGAPLTPIFHNLLAKNINDEYKIGFPISIINIGGISNITKLIKENGKIEENIKAFDLGPGNCLIDDWVRKNSNKRFDDNGSIAKSGKIDKLILNQAIENFKIIAYENSLDIKDFDISFARGLSLEDGCATITSFTGYLIAKGIEYSYDQNYNNPIKYLICGGGRKNNFLIECIRSHLGKKNNIILEPIEKYGFDGDYIESQAFGYLAIRSFLKLPISFPNTTGCISPTVGGKLVKNF